MISIFLDTNVLFSKEQDFTKALFGERLLEIVDEIESNDLYETVQIFIPQIVLDELLMQQLSIYEDTISKIKNVKFHNGTIDYDADYKTKANEFCLQQLEELKHSLVKVTVLPYPLNSSLEAIIKRAIDKKAPFEGKSKESDKGFKDVILWETILQYKNAHATDTIILFSGDGRICDASLGDEYASYFNDKIYLIKKESNLKNKDLFDCIEKLTSKKIEPPFSQQIELRLLALINDDNISPLFFNDTFKKGDDIFRCAHATIISKEITQINDKIEDHRIKFTIDIILRCVLKEEVQSAIRNEFKLSNEIISSNFLVDYSFSDDTFYLREYDSLSKGRIVLILNNIELEQNTEDAE